MIVKIDFNLVVIKTLDDKVIEGYLLIKTNLLDFDIQYTRNFSNLTIVIFISSIPIKRSCKINLKAKVGFESPINTKSMNSSVLFKTLLSFNSALDQTF